MTDNVDVTIERPAPRYEPFGWEHWPDFPMMSYQFRRGLGETQEGGGAVGESFLAASRMIPGDRESWHHEWTIVGDANRDRGFAEEGAGHIVSAQNCWMRASEYYRQAEFWLEPDDPRRMATFEKLEECTRSFLRYLDPPGEVLEIPYEEGRPLAAYFARSSHASGKQPVLISMGGLDSFKDEMWFMQASGALKRGFSVLMIDGPGQGASLRRHKIASRADYEVPIGKCIDYLETRDDVDLGRIALCGSSLGGYYSARAASFDHRIAACVSHGVLWVESDITERIREHPMLMHLKWVAGSPDLAGTAALLTQFQLKGVLDKMRCPYLVVNGSHDVLGSTEAGVAYDYAKSKGVNATLRLTTPDETGADHCQHDNPTLGQELILDWIADIFGMDQRAIASGEAKG